MPRPWRDPNEPRKPKPTFHKKDKETAPKHFPGKTVNGRKPEPDPYQDGFLRMYLDDERPCPPGFTLYRTLDKFLEALDTVDLSTIYAISLDWYLGSTDRGTTAAEKLAEMLSTRRGEFSNLHIVTCHSSDHEEGAKMARLIAAPLRKEMMSDEERYPYVAIDVGRTFGKL